ncbi:hypothetical protein R9X50_00054500 [Acrodontium crateriforme]|uniref:FHA domain-containing protein n=1 Tax=Acrodontium crateriforme TaxID=150365 RepID=A0AAQ3R783_9PEZI|nr:hypothetical protein R9X50_00054500 [Acrodontium crateriforme]
MADQVDLPNALMSPTKLDHAASRRPSLLPAFEPLSSSPGLPRAIKRKFDDLHEERKYYPTPVPTSSTGILASSSPSRVTRPGLQRTISSLSERAPLGDVPTLELPANGESVLMGRSSNSSDYQLSANRHISRVHVRASYIAPDEKHPRGRVEVECMGWNGALVHCRGEIVELSKKEIFTSDRPMAQIIVDVQDTRVMLMWPKEVRESGLADARSPWGLASSPAKRRALTPTANLASSPPPFPTHAPRSPESPSPAQALHDTFTSTFRAEQADGGAVQVYEDHASDEDAPHESTEDTLAASSPPRPSAAVSKLHLLKASQSSLSSEPEDFSEHDEENDPIVHSFGPFGENILSRFESIQSGSPERKRKPLKAAFTSPKRSPIKPRFNTSPVKNHVINQLAFSRVHSIPLSTIHSNLPAELRNAVHKTIETDNLQQMTAPELQSLLHDIPCVGIINREGKDAAGKLLESEFYYVPEMDTDEMRRETVTNSLGKTSIRAARKQHKQYYWKRPRH